MLLRLIASRRQAFLCAIWCSRAAFGASQEFTISDNVDLVLLDVSVRDAAGAFVPHLKKDSFRVWEDGHPRLIKDFAAVDVPVTLGLVVDNSGSMAPKRAEVITAGLAFARASNPKDQFFVVNFNDSVTRGLPFSLPFTDNLQMLRDALYFGRAGGRTALYDAVAYALRHSERSAEQRRTLVVISDGRDNASSTALNDLLKDIESSRATIYTIGLTDPGESELNGRMLRKIAALTGGRYFEPKQLSDIMKTMAEISDDIRHRYTLAYTPDETSDTRKIRTVRVVATEGGHKLRVRHRTTYRIASDGR